MKTASWTISLFFNDEKTNVVLKKNYNNVNEIQKDFKLTKTFLYNCCRKDKYKKDSRKIKHTNSKYKRLKIVKQNIHKNGEITINSFY